MNNNQRLDLITQIMEELFENTFGETQGDKDNLDVIESSVIAVKSLVDEIKSTLTLE